MARSTTLPSKQLLALVALFSIYATVSNAQSPDRSGLEGNMSVSAYHLDGVYQGNSQRISASDQSCSPGQQVSVEVRNGRFALPWNDRQVFDARISATGTFYATTNGNSLVQAEKHMTIIPILQGRVHGPELVADYGTRWCRYRLEASQAGVTNHVTQR